MRASLANPSNRVTLGSGFLVPAGLAATADDLWAADYVTGTLFQLVANGVTLPAPSVVATGLVQPEGMAVDADGSLLVVESGAGRLWRVDPSTGGISTVAESLEVGLPALPNLPPTWIFSSVAVGPSSGAIFVSGDRASLVYRITP